MKRLSVKYIRDYIKKDYKVKDKCYICNSIENLELHHLYSLSELFNNWCDKNKINTDTITVDSIKQLREIFYKEEEEKLNNNNLYTLCKMHHERLHNIYGQRYSNFLASKVYNWLNIQKEKYGNSS